MDLETKQLAPGEARRKDICHGVEGWEILQKKYGTGLRKQTKLMGGVRQMEKKPGTATLVYGARNEAHRQAIVLAKAVKGKV